MNRRLNARTGMRVRLLCLLMLAALAGRAATRTFSGGPAQASLLELFTSEGCSSCPPAEAWLENLRHDPGLWRDFVPVAFHVNYWDRLGWPDRFASRQFTARQHAYVAAWHTNMVYTPGFVLNGRDWGGRPARKPPALQRVTGVLTVEAAGDRGVVTYAPEQDVHGAYEVHIVPLAGGIVSRVDAGENRGQTLNHEFVALSLTTYELNQGRAEFILPGTGPAGTRRALAVWVTHPGSTEPLQATGGWLD